MPVNFLHKCKNIFLILLEFLLDYTILDQGFNYTEPIDQSGELEYFNFTLYNQNGTTIYINLTVNEEIIAINQGGYNVALYLDLSAWRVYSGGVGTLVQCCF